MQRVKITFANKSGHQLSALLEHPNSDTKAYAIFAHCFTCSKNIAAASRISQALADKGVAVLRFDFTGLGNSEGDFANTNFSSNVDDLVAAADYLKEHYGPVDLLIGHSLGGAAVIAAAHRIKDSKAVVTLGAPAEPAHVAHLLAGHADDIITQGAAEICLAGRTFTIKKQFLDDINQQDQQQRISQLRKPLLIMHSPVDDTVGIENAAEIFQAAKHPKSFVSLDQADHLLSQSADALYVADTIAAWAGRYVLAQAAPSSRPVLQTGEVLVSDKAASLSNDVYTQDHHLLADEPLSVGGQNTGPDPYKYLLAALGACTSMTLRMYAQHKKLALDSVQIKLKHSKIHADDCSDCETQTGMLDLIEREVTVVGDLNQQQQQRLLEIADKCPVHKTLSGEIKIKSELS